MSDSLHFVIFSLNRAILCDHLLRSLAKHVSLNKIVITLIYGATDQDYERGFARLQQRHQSLGVKFVQKHRNGWKVPRRLLGRPFNLFYYLRFPHYRKGDLFNFRPLLEDVVAQSPAEFVAFLTDDSFFIQDFRWSEAAAAALREAPSQCSLSLRLGSNISGDPRPELLSELPWIRWSYGTANTVAHWRYRFSIDGHVYDRRNLLALMRRTLYVNPNTFEGMMEKRARLERRLSVGFGLRHSVLAGAELNRVQDVSPNNNLGIDNKHLNELYLRHFELELEHLPEVTCFHPEIIKLSVNSCDGQQGEVLYKKR